MHIVNLLEYQRRPAPRRFTLNPRWPCLLQTVENLTADGKADMLPGVITHPFAYPDHSCAQYKGQNQ